MTPVAAKYDSASMLPVIGFFSTTVTPSVSHHLCSTSRNCLLLLCSRSSSSSILGPLFSSSAQIVENVAEKRKELATCQGQIIKTFKYTKALKNKAIEEAVKVENMVKLKEEFDYESLARRLDVELDKLIMEHERQQKAFEDEIERMATEAQLRLSEAERNYIDLLEKENSKYEKDYMDPIRKLEDQLVMNQRKNEDSHIKSRAEFDHSISDNSGETEGEIGGHVLCAIDM